MKKTSFVFMTLFTILLSGLLMACSFKDAGAKFSESEIVVSVDDTINLEDYLEVYGVSKDDVSYRFSNPDMFECFGSVVKAVSSGKSFVYVAYKNNSLASTQIVVKKAFSKPTNFSLTKSGLLSWSAVSDFFDDSNILTIADSYVVSGTYIPYDETGREGKEVSIDDVVYTNSFQINPENTGRYALTVKANAKEYFDESDKSQTQTFYFGKMDEVVADSLNFSQDATFSWGVVAGAKYKVSIDGKVLGDYLTTNSVNLSNYFDNLYAGDHVLSVLAYDEHEQKMPSESESIRIRKLRTPIVEYAFSENGGSIKLANVDAQQEYVLMIKKLGSQLIENIYIQGIGDDSVDKLETTLEGVDAGVYELAVQLRSSAENTYKSRLSEVKTIYKLPKASIEGLGGNAVNGDELNIKVSASESLIETKISGIGDEIVDGLEVDQTEKTFVVEGVNSNGLSLSVRLLPSSSTNVVSYKTVYAINSDESDTVEFVKLAFDGDITHKYVEGKSVFEFDNVANADKEKFVLKNGGIEVDADDYEIVVGETKTTVKFAAKIEELYDTFEFEIFANADNEKISIGASKEKTLSRLIAPTTANAGNSEEKTYRWTASENASAYKLEIFSFVDKVEYEKFVNGEIELASIASTTEHTESATYTFDDEGYYHVRIYSLVALSNESLAYDSLLDSKEYLEETFYISEKLVLGSVRLGYNESYKNVEGFTDSTGYFVRVENGNIDYFEIKIDDAVAQSQIVNVNSTYTDYLLSEDFAEGTYEISVIGKANDQTIYLDSDQKTVVIEKLEAIDYDALTAKNLAYVDDLTQNVVVLAREGSTRILIKKDQDNQAEGDSETDAVYPINGMTNFDLEFSIAGTALADMLYETEYVYLDADTTVLHFERLETPTEFEFVDGKLKFEYAGDVTDEYVLDLKCKTPSEQFDFTIKFATLEATATYTGLGVAVPLGYSSIYRSISNGVVSINLDTLLSVIKLDETLKDKYNQATEILFEAYVYKNAMNHAGDKYLLSSLKASLKTNSAQNELKVEKMPSPVLEFDSETETTYKFKWSKVTLDNDEINALTEYRIYTTESGDPVDGTLVLDSASGIYSYEFSKADFEVGKFYQFYVVAHNPYYLESNNSNVVRIYKLKNVESVKVKKDGKLEAIVTSGEQDFVDKIKIDGTEYNFAEFVDFETTSDTLTISLIGKTEENTYYINSDSAVWTVVDFKDLAPTVKTVTYDNNGTFSWSKIGESAGLGTVVYRVLFKDVDGQTIYHDTKENSINILSGEVYNKINAGLTEGDVTVQVVAYLDTYKVAQGSIVYVADAQTVLDSSSMHNAFVYENQNVVTKLMTPNVEEVEFESVTFDNYPTFNEKTFELENVLNPKTTICFTGNYGDSANVMAFVNDNEVPVFSGEVSKVSGKYSFDIASANYDFNADGNMTVKIKVSVEGTIPSSLGSVEIKRAEDLAGIDFVADGEKLISAVEIAVAEGAENDVVGGIVVQLDYTQNGGTAKTVYALATVNSLDQNKFLLDLTGFVETNLSQGGTLKATAFVNNSIDNENEIYYLPSQNVVASQIVEVLAQVEDADIERKSGGFVINTPNGDDCVYIIECGAETFEVENESGEFYFEFPNDWMSGVRYALTIYAEEDGKVTSVKNVVEFELARVEQVDISSIAMTRDVSDLSKVTLSWDAVSNATGYQFRVYDKADSILIFETVLSTAASYDLGDVFGENYSKLADFGVVKNLSDFIEDRQLVFEIVAVGDVATTNNSYTTTFEGVLKGNESLGVVDINEILSVDEFGRLVYLSREGVEYLYELYTSNESDGWKQLVANSSATIFDTTDFSEVVSSSNDYFNVNIACKGNENVFELDSYNLKTESSALTLKFNNEIKSLGYSAELPTAVVLEILESGFDKIYVGLAKDAFFKGRVIEIPFVESAVAPVDSINKVYACDIATLIEVLLASGIEIPALNHDLTLYFWSYQESDADAVVKVLASKPKEFVFAYNTESTFEEIKAYGQIDASHSDYANRYAVFANADTSSLKTIGVYIKIENADGFKTIKFLTQDSLVDDDFDGKYVVNLTEVFEADDLINLSGEFSVAFARLQVQDDSKFVVTEWLNSYDDQEFVFNRLEAVKTLQLRSGNLYWIGVGESGKYYVYFAVDMDEVTQKIENFSFEQTSDEFYNVSNFIGTANSYYLAVQTYSEDLFTLPAKKVFVSENIEDASVPVKVYKNQVKSPLILKDGQIYIDWTANSEVVKNLAELVPDSKKLDSPSPFVDPFTFTLNDLLSNNVYFRIKFSPAENFVGPDKYYDVNAKDLLASLYLYGENNGNALIKTKLEVLHQRETNASTKTLLKNFISYCNSGSFGVANSRKIFDDIFETLQVGKYNVQYCLLGGPTSVNSVWYDFENDIGENLVYINEQPTTKIIKETDINDASYNVYKLLIKKSNIIDYDIATSSYIEKIAENYVIKLQDSASNSYVFELTDGTSLTLKGSEVANSVTVYETNEEGVETSGGEYLMCYINHNDGDSILSVYGHEIPKMAYRMQIYAVGTNVSMSSKSQHHSITFLGFGNNISVNNGTFIWSPQVRRTTTVIYKSANSSIPQVSEIDVGEDNIYSRFALDRIGSGLYEYIKFVMVGEVRSNSTFIDSEVYMFNNVYKLAQPTVVNNDYGYIGINIGVDNKEKLEESYSEANIYNFRIYNNVKDYDDANPSTFNTIFDINECPYIYDRNQDGSIKINPSTGEPIVLGVETLYYQAGTSEIDESHENYQYKLSENTATEFSVANIGSTVSSFVYKNGYYNQEGDFVESDYLRTFHLNGGLDGEGNIVYQQFKLAIRSEFKTINAEMMSDVEGLKIEDSVLSWDENKTSVSGLEVSESPVYKVKVVLYKNTMINDDQATQTNITQELVYYTAQNYFDFAKIENDLLDYTDADTLIKASVQSLALEVSETYGSHKNYVELVEGGYAYGNVVYKDTSTYVLISNVVSISGITRLNSIESGSLRVNADTGRLNWTFKAESSMSETYFNEKYGFEVVQKIDGEERVVSGRFKILNEYQGLYAIEFVEDNGSMMTGECAIYVFVTQGSSPTANCIKSFSTGINVVKLTTVRDGDYVVESDANSETLDLSNYFAVNPNNQVIMDIKIQGVVSTSVVFTKDTPKLFIFRDVPEDYFEVEGYAGYKVIAESQRAEMVFTAKNSSTNMMFSDNSETFLLQRSNWAAGEEIVWNEEVQEFSWQYDYNSFANDALADIVVDGYLANKRISIFEDEDLSVEFKKLDKYSIIFVEEKMANISKISYSGQTYYVDNSDLDFKYFYKAKALQETKLYENETKTSEALDENDAPILLQADQEILIVEELADSTKIVYNQEVYFVDSAALQNVKHEIYAGDLFEIREETLDYVIIYDNDDQSFMADLSTAVLNRPVYNVEVEYAAEGLGGNVDPNSIVKRTYVIENVNTFKPTVIGYVKISVSVKLGNTNIQSTKLVFDGYAKFDLFASGYGTEEKPYMINSEEQFRNIGYRMTKDTYLNSYYLEVTGQNVEEETKFYFDLQNDIQISAFQGTLFKGEFGGVLNGNRNESENFKITYEVSKTAQLSENITVAVGNVLGPDVSDTSTTFSQGASLFERLAVGAEVKNLDISAKYSGTNVSNHAIVAGLTISNYGLVSNVNTVGFDSTFFGKGVTDVVMAYAGVVGVNSGSHAVISNSTIKANMALSDANIKQLIYAGGIAFLNISSGIIENCTTGGEIANEYAISVSCMQYTGTVQIAGVVVTNSGAKVQNCENRLALSVTGSGSSGDDNYVNVYIAGIAAYAKGTYVNNTNLGELRVVNIAASRLVSGDCYART